MAVTNWNLDVVHSSAEFTVKHLGFSPFKGRFKTLEGTVVFDEDNPANSTVNASIDVRSIDLVGERFVGHMLGEDFFKADEYPAITFASKNVKVNGDRWTITGDLAIRGVSREVTLDAEFLGQGKHPFAPRQVAAWSAKTSFKRSDFGITWNVPLDNGPFYVGDEIQVDLVIEAARALEVPAA